jgi:hypothetical protein
MDVGYNPTLSGVKPLTVFRSSPTVLDPNRKDIPEPSTFSLLRGGVLVFTQVLRRILRQHTAMQSAPFPDVDFTYVVL